MTTKRTERKEPFAGLQVRVHLVREGTAEYSVPIRCPEDVVGIVKEVREWDREAFLTLALDIRNRVLGVELTAIGTLSAAPISPREVFKAALLSNADSLIFVHLHPSGCPEPSPEDMLLTQRLVRGAELLGLGVHDHIIVAQASHFSFAEHGLLDPMRENRSAGVRT
jgi:DNA repair protein RadC